MRSPSGARVLDIHSDPEHHRSVYTIVADEDELASALFAGIARAAELIDLREHVGIHPRVGAADVVPIVPLVGSQMARAREVALELGERVGGELGLPVFLYGESADGVRPAFFRQGWAGGAAAAHRQRRAAAVVRPADARPAGRCGADRRPAAADRVQHRAPARVASRMRRRSRLRCGRRVVACPACRRSGCCSRRAGRCRCRST